MCFFAGNSFAQKGKTTIQSLNAQIERAEAEIKKSQSLLNKIKKDKKVTQNELKLIISRISNRQNIVSSLNQQIIICEGGIHSKQSQVNALESEIKRLKKEYAAMIYAAYKNHLLNNSMAFLFASRDFQEMTLRINYMKRYNAMRERKAAELNSLSNVLSGEVAELNKQRTQLEESRKARDREISTLRKDETSYKQTSSQLAANEKKVSAKIKENARTKQNAQKQLQRLIAEEARRQSAKKLTTTEQKAVTVLSNNFEQNRGRFPYPVPGGVIIDRFGKHPHPTQRGITIDNKGVNIAGDKGSSIKCIFEGTVSRVVFIKGLNNCVMVKHGNYYTVYSNLAGVSVKAGQSVGRNEVIGRLPSEGTSDEWYLHFELWQGTTFLNPEAWLSR